MGGMEWAIRLAIKEFLCVYANEFNKQLRFVP